MTIRNKIKHLRLQNLKNHLEYEIVDKSPTTNYFKGKLLSQEASDLTGEEIAWLVSGGLIQFGWICSVYPDRTFSGEYYSD